MLDERTEGWAAGLRLAGLSLRGRDDVAAFVDDFAGSHRFVLDYLVEQVLARQPAGVTEFLLRTSLLASMNASLCEAVTGRGDASEILAALERDNVFVVALDDERQWYRYHHLFADVLQARLRSTGPAEVARLHRAASRWYVEHGIAAGRPQPRRSTVATSTWPLTSSSSPCPGCARSAGTTPPCPPPCPSRRRRARSRALLATFMAWTRLAEGDLEGVLTWLDEAESALPRAADLDADLRSSFAAAARARDDELRQLPAMIAVYRATVAQARGDVQGTIAAGPLRPRPDRAGRPLRTRGCSGLPRSGHLGGRGPGCRGRHLQRGHGEHACCRQRGRPAGFHRRPGRHVARSWPPGRGTAPLRTGVVGRRPHDGSGGDRRRPARRPRRRPARDERARRSRRSPRRGQSARRRGVAAGEPLPLVRGERRPARGTRRPRRRPRDARAGRGELPAGLLPRHPPDPGAGSAGPHRSGRPGGGGRVGPAHGDVAR